MPARTVIRQDGVILCAEVDQDDTKPPEPRGLFPVLDDLKLRASV